MKGSQARALADQQLCQTDKMGISPLVRSASVGLYDGTMLLMMYPVSDMSGHGDSIMSVATW